MRCPNCEHTNPRDARYCESCGTSFDISGGGGQKYPWTVPLVVLFLLLGIVIVVALVFNKKVEDLSDEGEASAGLQKQPAQLKPRPKMISTDDYIALVEGFAPLTVKLRPLSIEKSSEYGKLTFKWEFMPGEEQIKSGTGGRAVHTYTAPGIYHPKLTVSDSGGDIARQTWEVCVLPEESKLVIDKWQENPRDAGVNFARAQVYFQIGADSQGIYFALRAYFADPGQGAVVESLLEHFANSPAQGEYINYLLTEGAKIPAWTEVFSKKLSDSVANWQEERDRERATLNRAEYRTSTSIYNLLVALTSLHDYQGAADLVKESNQTEQQLNNMSWYMLNLGKPKEADDYAGRQLAATPGDFYALECKMLAAAVEGDKDKAENSLQIYMKAVPPRGHVVSVVMDLIIFSGRGVDKDFAWNTIDDLRVFI